MFCKKCGAEINENSAFCKKCGKPVTITYGISNDVQSSDVDNQHPKERFKGLAIAGFVLGIIGVFLFSNPWFVKSCFWNNSTCK